MFPKLAICSISTVFRPTNMSSTFSVSSKARVFASGSPASPRLDASSQTFALNKEIADVPPWAFATFWKFSGDDVVIESRENSLASLLSYIPWRSQ